MPVHLRALAAMLVVLAATPIGPALAEDSLDGPEYFCGAGDVSFVVVVTSATQAVLDITVSEMVDPGMAGVFDLTADPEDASPSAIYSNGAYSFYEKAGVHFIRERGYDPFSCAPTQAETTLAIAGRSLGGNLRADPSLENAPIGSLAQGTPVTILFDTEVLLSGYPWFEIELADGNRAFHWGGILCTRGPAVAGIPGSCAP